MEGGAPVNRVTRLSELPWKGQRSSCTAVNGLVRAIPTNRGAEREKTLRLVNNLASRFAAFN